MKVGIFCLQVSLVQGAVLKITIVRQLTEKTVIV